MDIDANKGTVHLGPLQMKILEFVAACVIYFVFDKIINFLLLLFI